jgi:hypothetical protein
MSLTDFERHPVWIGVHGRDESEWWYEETDEATFRPWLGALLVSPDEGNLRVRADFALPDGRRYEGYVSPVSLNWDVPDTGECPLIGRQQPSIFVGEKRFSFWGGMAGIPLVERQAFYSTITLRAELAFPLRFAARAGLATGIVDGTVFGFYQWVVKKDRTRAVQLENDEGIDPPPPATVARGVCEVPIAREELPPADRSPTSQYAVWLKETLPEAIKTVESDPSDLSLHLRVCQMQFQLGDYEECLRYSDSGLAAVGGYKGTRDMNRDDLTFFGARALFELARHQEALDHVKELWPSYSFGPATDLLTKKGLMKACKAALRLQQKTLSDRKLKTGRAR